MKKRGRQPGQSGAKVYKIGNSGHFQMNGSWEKYQEEWEYLQRLSDRQGARTEVIMEALRIYRQIEVCSGERSPDVSGASPA